MFGYLKKYSLPLFTLLLATSVIFIFYLDFRSSERMLTVAMLDIGQGDAIFIESPTGVQVLIDAGPPRKILGELSRMMPFFDRSLDAFIATHPDQDHTGGFGDVLKDYKVGLFLESGGISDSKVYQNLKGEIKNKNIPSVLARRGMLLHLGGGAVIEIIFPDRDVSLWETNDGSIVARLVYGETTVLLTGDSSLESEKVILANSSVPALRSDVLKVGHHGSRTSSSYNLVKTVLPKYALISSGKDNSYGHPHQEVLELLDSFGVEILRTDRLGTIIMKSDGVQETFSFRK
ncbi:MAG: MBL fold metallo-hydrolase [Candidatus Paceibacterota bacterium]